MTSAFQAGEITLPLVVTDCCASLADKSIFRVEPRHPDCRPRIGSDAQLTAWGGAVCTLCLLPGAPGWICMYITIYK